MAAANKALQRNPQFGVAVDVTSKGDIMRFLSAEFIKRKLKCGNGLALASIQTALPGDGVGDGAGSGVGASAVGGGMGRFDDQGNVQPFISRARLKSTATAWRRTMLYIPSLSNFVWRIAAVRDSVYNRDGSANGAADPPATFSAKTLEADVT
jgi:hypothetical protein